MARGTSVTVHRPTPTRAVLAAGLLFVGISVIMTEPAAAGHLACGSTLTSDVRLDSDLTCPAGAPALNIGASGVSIDLNGHTITSDSLGGVASAIRSNGFSEVSVTDGTIVDYGFGIWLQGGQGHVIEKMRISNIGYAAIVLDGTDDSTVAKNDVVDSVNRQIGIFVAGDGNLIERNSAAGFGVGISLIGSSSDNVIQKNFASGNGDGFVAVLFSDSFNNMFRDNESVANSDDGYELLLIGSGGNNEVRGNTANANARRGVFVDGWLDGGKNQATGNGLTDCVGVAC